MAEPSTLTFGVLPRGDEDLLTSGVPINDVANELTHNAISGGVPRRRVGRNLLDESPHFVHPPSIEHGVESCLDTTGEGRSRIDDKIACRAPCGTCPRAMEVAQAVPAD